jgi:hypothetical protein
MNDINHRKEVHLLEKCLNEGQCEAFVRQYWNLIYYMVKKLFLQRNYPFSEMDLEDMVGDVFVQIFQDNCRKLRLYNKEKGTKISVLHMDNSLSHARLYLKHHVGTLISTQSLMIETILFEMLSDGQYLLEIQKPDNGPESDKNMIVFSFEMNGGKIIHNESGKTQ